MSPAEQIARFIERHPGEWRVRYAQDVCGEMVLETVAGWLVLCPHITRSHVCVTASRHGPDDNEFCASDDERDAPILAQAAARFGDMIQVHGGTCDTLPPWLADPVRRELRRRAGELLTLAGSSPADVVSAAETVDEALCGRPVVEVTGILPALMAIGMSCRWVADPVTPAAPKPDTVFNRALLEAIKRADHLAYGDSLAADLVADDPVERARILAEVEAWRSVAAALRGLP